jgi:SAM-dependent methyltransferase
MEEQKGTNEPRASYDRLATQYTRHLFDELDRKPLDRELLARFAREVRGPVCDLGCGPGHVARHLQGLGVDVFGVDLSPGMVEEARRLNPEIEFREGDMLSLEDADGSLGGIVAFYSVVHLRREELPRAFGEMRRALAPGGLLLLSFHVGDEVVHLDELWGVGVSLDFRFFRTDEVVDRLTDAGFQIEDIVERGPYGEDVEAQTRRAYVFARKPSVS